MHMRTITILLCCTALFALSGCGILWDPPAPTSGTAMPGAGVTLTDHSALSLYNYRMARAYSAQGRYELAKEHFLMAHAAAGDDALLRDMLAREIEAADMMIRTLR